MAKEKEPQQPLPQNKPKPPAPPAPKAKDRDDDEPERRGFMIQAGAVVVGGVVAVVPAAAGLFTIADPLRKKERSAPPGAAPVAGDGKFIAVARLDEIPDNGAPVRFPVHRDEWDAWNFYPQEPVGAVYLRRVPGEPLPTAVTATCPHLGCSVVFNNAENRFQCPCHDSLFEPDGKRINPETCPSARDLDTLNVEVKDNIVLVEFQKFKGGSKDKIVKG